MVAGTGDLYSVTDRHTDRFRRRLSHCSIYLHSFLMKDKHLGTILIFVMVLIILFLVNSNVKVLYIALALGAIAVLIPALSRKIHDVWMKFAELIGLVMNKVILSVVFFVFLVPVAFLSRLFRKNPFRNKKDTTSYFSDRNFTYNKKSLEQLW
jgi:O-antigen ligase